MKNLSKLIFLSSKLTLAIFICSNLWASTKNSSPMKKKLDKIIQKISHTAHISIQIETLGEAKVLYSYQAKKLLIPASATKVITTANALHSLGPAHTVKTKFFTVGPIKDGILHGDLIIYGSGDPYLVSEHLWKIARQIARKGIKEINGSILVNDSYFSDNMDTMTNFTPSRTYAAKVTSINLNFNSAEIHITAIKSQNKPSIDLGPSSNEYGIFENKIKFQNGTHNNIKVYSKGRKGDKEIFHLSGVMGRDSPPITIYHPVKNSPAYFSYALSALLEKEGIKVKNSFAGTVKENKGKLFLEWESFPVSDIVKLYNTYSNNIMADQIFYLIGENTFGPPANKQKALEATSNYLKNISSCKSSEIRILNGSGLNWDTRLHSKCLLDIIQKTYKEFNGFADLLGSFPIGAKTGTLKDRFKNIKKNFSPASVRAKTGTLFRRKGVTALVGFTSSTSGKVIVFSILINRKKGFPSEIFRLRQWEENIINVLQTS